MARIRGLLIAALVLLVMPAGVSAQGDNSHTREATRHIGLAMTRQDDAERQQMYQQALTALEAGMQDEPDHAKTWFLAGGVYAALGQFQQAHEAFNKAVELYPDYQADLAIEREQAWVHAFNAGVAAMDTQDYSGAIAALEAANQLYPQRPEAYLNLASLYSNQNEPERAIEVLETAIEIIEAADPEQVQPETLEQWGRYAQLARINMGQIQGQAGIIAFQEEDYDRAAQLFKAAAEVNPHSRDFRYNYVQSVFAKTQDLEEARDSVLAAMQAATGDAQVAANAELERHDAELMELYDELLVGVDAVQPIDPNNEMLYVIAARAHRMKGVLSGDQAAAKIGQDKALELLTQRDQLPVEVSTLAIDGQGEAATIAGTLRNRSVPAGTPVVLRLTLLGIDGAPVGEGEITVTAPAADTDTEFEGSIPVTGEIAGWRYQVVS